MTSYGTQSHEVIFTALRSGGMDAAALGEAIGWDGWPQDLVKRLQAMVRDGVLRYERRYARVNAMQMRAEDVWSLT